MVGGCSALSAHTPNAAELGLERAQLVQISEGLLAAQPAVARELAAARAVWPLISSGLPRSPSPRLDALLKAASAGAKRLPYNPFTRDPKRLTGPASGLASLWEHYVALAEHGSALTLAASRWLGSNSATTAAYGRSSSALYIDATYDAHFELSLIGKSLLDGYRHLGGERSFGPRLTPARTDALANAYSISAVRLTPHPGRSIESP